MRQRSQGAETENQHVKAVHAEANDRSRERFPAVPRHRRFGEDQFEQYREAHLPRFHSCRPVWLAHRRRDLFHFFPGGFRSR